MNKTQETIMSGLELAVGNAQACEILVRFNEKYDKKHGSYFDNAVMRSFSAPTPDGYHKSRENAFERYAMMRLYVCEKSHEDLHHIAQANKQKRFQSPCGEIR